MVLIDVLYGIKIYEAGNVIFRMPFFYWSLEMRREILVGDCSIGEDYLE